MKHLRLTVTCCSEGSGCSGCPAMDGVLEASVGLCVCKLVLSLLFLPSLAASNSPISFCCCCLLVFTDFLVTAFLSFLCIFEPWLTDLTAISDLIALRFLLFLSHVYGLVLLLTIPLIAVETLTRPQWPHSHGTLGHTVSDADGQRYAGEVTAEEEEEEEEEGEEDDSQEKERRLFLVVSYLCCLSVWVVVALSVGWSQEDMRTAACLHRTDSLIRCLPSLLRPMSSTLSPCWIIAFLYLLLLLLTMRPQRTLAQMAWMQREKRGLNNNSDSCWQDLAPAPPVLFKPVNSETSVSVAVHCVDPETTESSCTIRRECSWNSAQVSTTHHGDFVIILSAGQEQERTKTSIPLTFSTKDPMDSEYRSRCGWRRWGFPRLGVNVMIGIVGVLSIFVLPLNLSVNILLIRTIESLLERCIRPLVSSAPNSNNISSSHSKTPA